jgi:hypothetical protein
MNATRIPQSSERELALTLDLRLRRSRQRYSAGTLSGNFAQSSP